VSTILSAVRLHGIRRNTNPEWLKQAVISEHPGGSGSRSESIRRVLPHTSTKDNFFRLTCPRVKEHRNHGAGNWSKSETGKGCNRSGENHTSVHPALPLKSGNATVIGCGNPAFQSCLPAVDAIEECRLPGT